jgi:hypothetical protein
VLADQALRVGSFGLAASATFGVGAVGLVFAGSLKRFQSRLLVAIATVFAVWFSVRTSPWLLWPDVFACLALLGLAASFAMRGSIVELGAAELAARSIQAIVNTAAGAQFVLSPIIQARGRFKNFAPLVRGLAIALPIAVLLGGLLASADPVFASFFSFNLDFGQLLMDVAFVAFGSLLAAGLLRAAASESIDRVDGPVPRLGATEALVVLLVLDAVFAAFAVAQLMAASGAGAGALRSAGITYSDYARSGFFQLLWVSGITLVVLVVFSRISRLTDHKSAFRFLILAETAVALTLVVVAVAFMRLSLYEEAYGFTMLRLYSHLFAAWIAVVFLLLAADFAHVWRQRRWFVGSIITTGVALLLALNFVNPEAIVVALNTSHAQSAHKIDAAYMSELSSDATPALLASRGELDPSLRQDVDRIACAGTRSYAASLAAFNWSEAQAAAVRRASC